MIFKTRIISALALLSVGASSFAVDSTTQSAQEIQKAKFCINWLVDGASVIHAAKSLTAETPTAASPGASFPLPYILTNVGLSGWIPQAWKDSSQVDSNPQLIYSTVSQAGALSDLAELFPAAGSSVISLGEGRSGVLPLLLGQGLKAIAVDPENDLTTGLRDNYVAKYFSQALPGDATDLSLFADQSQKTVISHMLLPHLSRSERVAVLRESFRVLAVGGTARHSLLIPDVNGLLGSDAGLYRQYTGLLVDSVRQLVQDALGETGYQVSVFLDEPRMQVKGSTSAKIGDLVDLEVNTGLTLDGLVAQSRPLEKKALNLLIVLRRPDNSWNSWEGWFGR